MVSRYTYCLIQAGKQGLSAAREPEEIAPCLSGIICDLAPWGYFKRCPRVEKIDRPFPHIEIR